MVIVVASFTDELQNTLFALHSVHSMPAKKKKATTQETPLGWQAATLATIRRLIQESDPEIVEERKWIKPTNPAGVPVWSHGGIVCTGETYRQTVKVTFARGASLPDPQGLFNASLEGNARRAIDLREGEKLNAKAFKALIKSAVAANLESTAAKAKSSSKVTTKKSGTMAAKLPPRARKSSLKDLPRNADGVVLLSGGNPQIAKADGDAPVQAYIAAMPGWKSGLGKRLDHLIVRAIPAVQKAVRWNSPFYGVEGQGWFASFHVLTRYVKVTFFKGAQLQPIPPGAGKDKDARWIDIYEDDTLDEVQFVSWVQQAAAIPGWKP
jgi:hypothetical protein